MDAMVRLQQAGCHESRMASSAFCATTPQSLHCHTANYGMVRFAGLPSTTHDQTSSCLATGCASARLTERFENNIECARPSVASYSIQPAIKHIERHGNQRHRNQSFVVHASTTMIKPVDRDYFESIQSLESLIPTSTVLSDRWRDIQGAHNWDGLLDPIDPDLKGELIRYGEFAQVCYDAFDSEKHSKYCGSCKYNRRKVLENVGLKCAADYEVTKYLYSTNSDVNPLRRFFHKSESTGETWSRDSNWIGFVAVSTSASEIQRLGRRDIVVAWRGTVTTPEWIRDLEDWLSPAAFDPGSTDEELSKDVKVERGFRSIYTSKNEKSRYNKESAQEQVLSEIKRLLNKYEGEEVSITVTGHSLGAALALLSAYDIAESETNLPAGPHQYNSTCRGSRRSSYTSHAVPITVITFAGPRVGNDAFRERCEELRIKTLRVVNEKDVVPNVPGVVMNEHMHVLRSWIDKLPWTYSHVGVELALNTQDSPYLKWGFLDFGGHHNLEAYLHLLDAYHGTQKRFSSFCNRDLALVNKFSQLLKPECGIPAFWWQQENKGLQKNKEGGWVQFDREEEDIPIVYRDA